MKDQVLFFVLFNFVQDRLFRPLCFDCNVRQLHFNARRLLSTAWAPADARGSSLLRTASTPTPLASEPCLSVGRQNVI